MKHIDAAKWHFPTTRYLRVVSILLLSALCVNAQSMTETLIVQAKRNATAMLNKDYETIVLFMYPQVVRSMGGYKKALDQVKKMMLDVEAKGGTLDKITVGQPSTIVQEGSEHVAIVPTKMEMRFEGKKVWVSSYLVAITQDRGKLWYFLDGGGLPEETLAKIYPKLVLTVEIPKRRNSLEDEINDSFRRMEEKEGKPIEQILNEQIEERRLINKKIDDNGLRTYIEKREGKRLGQIPIVRLKEILKELKLQ